MRALARTRGALFLVVAYAVVAVVCAFLPLADHLGFELAAALTIAAAIAAPAVGFAAIRLDQIESVDRRRPSRAAAKAGAFAAAALVVPALLILLNGLRRPICDPVVGGLWLLVLPAPTAWLAATFAALARSIAPRLRWAIGLVVLAEVGSLIVTVAALYYGPVAFALDHFIGYLPGPLYDERIPFSAALLSFRATTVLWGAAAVATTGAVATADREIRRMHLAWAIGLSVSLVTIGAFLGTTLNWRTTDASLRAALRGEIVLPRLVLHFPSDLLESELELFVRDATFDEALLETRLGMVPAKPIHLWLYASTDQKRRLFGAANTQVAKGHSVFLNRGGFPHGSLRHELVHIFTGELDKHPSPLDGVLMNSVFVEGFAVAYDLDDGTLTPIQEAKAMRDLRIAPNLERLLAPGGFQREASSRAYTYSGAFMRYLDGRFGTPAMRRMYATKDLVVLGPPKTLIADFERMLDTVTSDAVARSSSANRNAEPSIFQRRCARQVSEIVDSAFALSRNRRWNEAIVKFDEACALQPDDPTFVDYKLNTAIAMKPSSLSRILAIADTLWRHPTLDPLRESSSRTRVGDELWRRGDTARARAQYARAAALPTGRSGSTVTMRLRATQDPTLAQLIMPYYTETGAQPAAVLRMSDAIAAGRQDALLAYLVGNYYLFRSTLDKAGDLLDRAATIGLNDPVLTRVALSGVISARAQRHRCDDAERARIRLHAAAGSATELAIAGDWVDRCRFAVARGWSPVQ